MEKGKEKKEQKESKQENMKIEHQNNFQASGKDKQLQKQKNKFVVYYSAYGYIKINQSEMNKSDKLIKFIQYRQHPFKQEDCLRGTIYMDNMKKEINIQIKTFFNNREIYKIEKVNINSPLNLAVQKLFELQQKEKDKDKEKKEDNIEHITKQSQYRIFSVHKNIHQLNPLESIIENFIQENELLLYLPVKELSFSEYIKDSSILISKEGKIASKVNTDSSQYALGNIYYLFGKHYFEVNLLTEPIAESVIIGVATKRNPMDKYVFDVHNFYGLILSDSQKISIINGKTEKKEYNKESFNVNDIVGVLLEFKKDGLEISFYKNKICLGVAYNKIKNDKIFFPAIKLGYAGSKVRISNQIDFP